MRKISLYAALFLSLGPLSAQPSATDSAIDLSQPNTESKRIFLIIPNNRAAPSFKDFKSIGPREKFGIASRDAFDPGTVALAAAFAGEAQITSQSPSFGTGATAYGHYFVTQYADLLIGDYMTEAIFPTLFHQDPRYFRSSETSKWKRLRYAATRVVITYSDHGKKQFNVSELAGNSAATALSSAYYPDRRNASDAIAKLSTQLAVDMVSDIMKEFWPEISRKFTHKH